MALIYVKRIFFYLLIILLINVVLMNYYFKFNTFSMVIIILLLIAPYIFYNIKPEIDRSSPRRQKVLIGGY